MAGVDIGGDESVQWRAQGDNVRRDPKVLLHEAVGERGWLQQGIDEAKGEFTVSIKRDGSDPGLYKRIREAAERAEEGKLPACTFTLPIVYGAHNQIGVRWESDLSVPPTVKGSYTAAAGLTTSKKKGKKGKKAKAKPAKKGKKKAAKKRR